MKIRLTIEEQPRDADVKVVEHGLTNHSLDLGIEPRNYRDLSVFLRGDDERIVGGLVGATVWGWLHVKLLWVDAGERGKGRGAELLRAAEAEAQRRGCHHALLDTFDFQAPEFYDRQGYSVFGSLPEFPRGHTRIFLQKALV